MEFTDYAKDKTLSLEDQYGCLGPIGIAAVESTDTASECAEENKYNDCSVTVAELEACVEEYAVFGYLTLAKGFSASAEVAEEQGAAAASEEAGGMAEGFGDFTEAVGGAIGLGSCEAPEPTPLSGECMVVATACPDLFPDTNLPPSGLPGGDMPGMEGGEEAAAEEGGEEAPAEEGGEEAPAEEGGEEAPAEEGGEA